MTLKKKITEVLSRWFENPPYPLPEWITKDFVRGVVLTQQADILSELKKEMLKRLPKEGLSTIELKTEDGRVDIYRLIRLSLKSSESKGRNQALSEVREIIKGLGD